MGHILPQTQDAESAGRPLSLCLSPTGIHEAQTITTLIGLLNLQGLFVRQMHVMVLGKSKTTRVVVFKVDLLTAAVRFF